MVREESFPAALRGRLAGACFALAFATAAPAQQITMKIGYSAVRSGQDHWAEVFRDGVAKRAPGRLKVEMYPGGQLGSPTAMIQGVQLAPIESIQTAPEFLTIVDPRFDAFTAPGLFDGVAHQDRALHDPEVKRVLWPIVEPKNMKILGFPCETIADYGSIEPIRTIGDFKGKKIRVLGSKLEIETMRRVGATGVPMQLGEALPALQQKAIDGTRSGIPIFVGFKYITVMRNILQTHESFLCIAKIVSKRWFEGLSADLQKIMLEEAVKADQANLPFNLALLDKLYAAWRAQGGVINEFPPAERAEYRRRVQTVGDEVFKDTPQVKAAYDLLKAAAARTRK